MYKRQGLPSQGLYITQISADSDLYAQGINRGDVLLTAGGVTLSKNSDLLKELENYKPGDTIELTVQNCILYTSAFRPAGRAVWRGGANTGADARSSPGRKARVSPAGSRGRPKQRIAEDPAPRRGGAGKTLRENGGRHPARRRCL